jgi:hypothetical protein
MDLSREFGGCLTDITKTNLELERKLETLTTEYNHKIENMESKHQLHLKDKEIEILNLNNPDFRKLGNSSVLIIKNGVIWDIVISYYSK